MNYEIYYHILIRYFPSFSFLDIYFFKKTTFYELSEHHYHSPYLGEIELSET